MNEGIKRLAVVLGCLGALAHLIFMAVFTKGLTEMDHTLSVWTNVVLITTACFLLPFGLVHGIYWIVRGFNQKSGTPKGSSNQAAQRTGTKVLPRQLLLAALLLVPAVGGPLVTPETAMAQAWKPTTAPSANWSSIASSANGSRLVAAASGGLIYTSTNYGTTWAPTAAPSDFWKSVACSADGRIMAAAASRIYVSTNLGLTWTGTDAFGLAVACSADGRNLVAAAGGGAAFGPIQTSSDSGATWNIWTNSLVYGPWHAVSSSADGMVLTAVGYLAYQGAVGGICISTNSGATWVLTHDGSTWGSVASSADGGKLIAANYYPGTISISTNRGATWTQSAAPALSWQSVASSADGAKLLAAAGQGYGNGQLYSSTNWGVSWNQADAPSTNWSCVALSADGCRQVAAVGGYPSDTGLIYTSQIAPAPLLNIAPGAGNLVLSWTVPSINFTLQQSPALGDPNWTDVAMEPVLNPATLQYEQTIATPGGTTFYRLLSR